MIYSKSEVLQYVSENDVKFIKLFFTDVSGRLKSVSIQPSILEKAFDEGISFDGSAIKGFSTPDKSDLFLVPDPSTLNVLPWRPQQGRVIRMYCNVKNPDGTEFAGDFRNILAKTEKKASERGFEIQIGTECEFYLFKLDENGMATHIPYDLGGYCDLSPIDLGENVRRDIIFNLEQMGIAPLTSHHETGPGQNEIDFKYDTTLRAADNYFTFKNTVKTIAFKDGVFASFNPKPIIDEAGNGLHINVSILKNGENLYKTDSEEKKYFIQGILNRIREITVFFNTTPESYWRLGKFEAPKYVSWSSENRSQLIRIPSARGEESRFELRSPDTACNLYLALTLLIEAGLEGIEKKMELVPSCDKNLLDASDDEIKGLEKLPETLEEAIEIAKKSDFVKSIINANTLDSFFRSLEEDIVDYYDPNKNFKRWITF